MSSNIIYFSVFLYCLRDSFSVVVCPSFKDYFFPKINDNCHDNPDGEAEKPVSTSKITSSINNKINFPTNSVVVQPKCF